MVRETVIAVTVLAALAAGCSNDRGAHQARTERARSALTEGRSSVLIPWGHGPGEVGLEPAMKERAAFGVSAVAVGPNGEAILLDAVNERVVRVTEQGLETVARAPKDADDLAVAADGALAIHRMTTPKILVLTAGGERIGEVDASPVGDLDSIALGPSRRVVATNAYQETFQLGSPSAPNTRAAVLHGKREGAARLSSGAGLVSVVRDGRAELRVVAQGDDRTVVRETHALGAATAARIVGVDDGVACVRREHVDTNASGPIAVHRDALCVTASTGAHVLEVDLPDPGLYVPRRELAHGHGKLVLAHPEPDGLRVMTWNVGGAR